ncbi:MAG: hypothetical protein ACJAV6_000155 [Candidatus Paceibacteria bacterium]
MEEQIKIRFRKTLKIFDYINNYLIAFGVIYTLITFTQSDLPKNINELFFFIWNEILTVDFIKIFLADMGARFVVLYYIIRSYKHAFFSSLPLGVGWLYIKYLLRKNP